MINDTIMTLKCPSCGCSFHLKSDCINHKKKAKVNGKNYLITYQKCEACDNFCTLQVDDEASMRLLALIGKDLEKVLHGIQSEKALKRQSDLKQMRKDLTSRIAGKIAVFDDGLSFEVMPYEQTE